MPIDKPMGRPMQQAHFIVLWTRPGWRIAIVADVFAASPRLARERFLELFPDDCVCGVKLHRGNGRFI